MAASEHQDHHLHKQNVAAALLVILGMAMISSNDALMKLSSTELGVGQLLFVRGSLAVILFSLFIKLSGRPLFPRRAFSRWNGLRALCECCATVCFITGLTLLPIAIASTLVWTTPMMLTLAAAFLLKENVSTGRWLAVLVGFAGVLLVTNPFGESFSPAMLLPLLAAVFVTARDLTTRRIEANVDSLYIVLTTLTTVTVVGFLMALFDWRPVTLTRTGWLALSALLLGLGFLCQITAVRKGELSFIAPFSYTGILVAVFWGYMVWQQWPSNLTFAGIALIVGSGMYILTVGRISRRGIR
ncbi:MAG: DMT family transporter [bacterium]